MNNETYEALKSVLATVPYLNKAKFDRNKDLQKSVQQIHVWIDEVAKEYEEDI